MSRTKESQQPHQSQEHAAVTAVMLGSLSLLLAAGLWWIGLPDRMDGSIAKRISLEGVREMPKALPDWSLWVVAAALAIGLAYAMLRSPHPWQRAWLFVSTFLVTAAWAPVLVLASHQPSVTLALIAVTWSGTAALIYSANPSGHKTNGK